MALRQPEEFATMESASRRIALQRLLQLACAAVAVPLTVRAAQTCGDATSEPLRESLHYSPAPAAAQACAACSFFTADSNGACGACAIMGGPVDRGSHCDSWSAKS
jgi:hypothetical protein